MQTGQADGFERDSYRNCRGRADHASRGIFRASRLFPVFGLWRSAIAIESRRGGSPANSTSRRCTEAGRIWSADPNVDAVVIGAWPYLHCPVTLAAFDAGKHVLTQARMAMNAREAQRMLDRSLESPRLTAMIVPSPYGLAGDAFMRSLIDSGYLGNLREVHVHSLERPARRPGNADELATDHEIFRL